MNPQQEHQGESTLLAAFSLAALPPEAYRLTVQALQTRASYSQIHAAASAIAAEVEVGALPGVLAALIFMAQDSGHGEGLPTDLLGNDGESPAGPARNTTSN